MKYEVNSKKYHKAFNKIVHQNTAISNFPRKNWETIILAKDNISYTTKFMILSSLSFVDKILIIYDKNAVQNNFEVFITEVIEYS